MKLPEGFLVSGVHCGIKKKNLDLGLIYCQDFSQAVGFFTTNANAAYSVLLSKKNIKNPIKAVLVNSGNANCYSHKSGLRDTANIIFSLAKKLGVKAKNILIASTGIIGKKLPKAKIISGFVPLEKNLGKQYKSFAQSIITTDTFTKVAYRKLAGHSSSSIIGFAKGAGMIYPNMATLLGFILTDAGLAKAAFKKIAQEVVAESFNSISVDGCMSTNDTVFFLSSGKVPLKGKLELNDFSKKLKGLCLDLAKLIIKDAEGASKFIRIKIKGAKSKDEAKRAGLALANSALFKSALYGQDANWGRIISSFGQAGIKIKEKLDIKSTSLKKKNVEMIINLKRGNCTWDVYTCDLTPQYVKLNAQYN